MKSKLNNHYAGDSQLLQRKLPSSETQKSPSHGCGWKEPPTENYHLGIHCTLNLTPNSQG